MSEIHSLSISVNRKPVWISLILLIIFVTVMVLSFSYSYRQSSMDNKRIALSSELSSLALQLYTSTMSTVQRNTGSFKQVEQKKKNLRRPFKHWSVLKINIVLGLKAMT